MSILAMAYTLAVSLASAELIRGVAAARRTQSPYRARQPLDAEHGVYVRGTLEAAFLSGGPARAADALIAGLHEDGRLVVAGPGVVGIPRPAARNAGEQAVVDAHSAAPSGALHWLRAAVMRSLPVQETGEALARRGLLVRPGRQRRWRRWAGAQIALTFFGFVVCAVVSLLVFAADFGSPDESGGPGTPFEDILILLPGAVFGVVSGAICLAVTSKQLTVAGRYALREYVASAQHLTGAAHLVATRGLAAAHPDLRAQLIAAARVGAPAAAPTGPAPAPYQDPNPWNSGSGTPTWCGSGGGGGGFACSGGGGGSSCSGGGSSCSGGGGSSCSGGGSSCSSGGGSSCGGGGGSSCGGGGS
ncbi:TIGR04222 domain-containing membrane protein [Streptomyces sp. NPDC004732]|uniref:TIGR04222 domain-containing membrane protein n=1 Tax=Streptomyces sp. NPDC004732 TaxID=3154290 RepID=UPI0033B7F709